MPNTSSSHSKKKAAKLTQSIAYLFLITILPMMVQCSGIGYKSISFSRGKLSTPPTTLSQRDYPFDAKGRYRTDWVKSGSTKKRSKTSFRSSAETPAQPQTSHQTVVAQAPPAPTKKPKKTSTRTSRKKTSSTSMTLAANTASTAKPRQTAPAPAPTYTPAPPPAPPKPKAPAAKPEARYHKIAKGDTLWGISRRYKVGIAAIKSANGLSSDLIRPGQTLRIP